MKVALLGEGGVGHTALANRYCKGIPPVVGQRSTPLIDLGVATKLHAGAEFERNVRVGT